MEDEDSARALEMRAERLAREVDELRVALGLVEVDVLVGEEPDPTEAGVEVEVTRWPLRCGNAWIGLDRAHLCQGERGHAGACYYPELPR